MDTHNYTYIEPTSEVLNVVTGLTYACPECDHINMISSREEVYGVLAERIPDKYTIDLIFAHECTHCTSEVTVSHYLPREFRVWMKQGEE